MKINLLPNQQLFFTSDTHYSHKNIVRGTTSWQDSDDVTRDFQTVDDMNSVLVKNINSTVGEDDILIHLGDWSFGGFEKIQEFRSQIKCKNIYLVLGNHDHHILNNKENVRDLFLSVDQYLDLTIGFPVQTKGEKQRKQRFILCHYPIASWHDMNQGVTHLHGHVHLPPHQRLNEGKAMDVGMDGNNLFPINIEDILQIMNLQPVKKLTLPKDHHEKRRESL